MAGLERAALAALPDAMAHGLEDLQA